MAGETLRIDIKGRNDAAGAFAKARGDLDRLKNQFVGMKSALAGAFAVTTVNRFGREVRQVVAEMSNIGKVADRADLTTEAIQRLRFGFELAGVEVQTTDEALAKFSIQVAEAARGTGELAPFLEANNVALRDGTGRLKSQGEMLRIVAGLIQRAGSAQEKTNIAVRAFGEQGAKMVLGLKGGAAGLRELMAQADKAGGVIDDKLVRRMEAVDDKLAIAERRFKIGFKSGIVIAVDALDIFANKARQVESALSDIAGSGLIEKLAQINPALFGSTAALIKAFSDPAAPDSPADTFRRRSPAKRLGPRNFRETVIPTTGGDKNAADAQKAADTIRDTIEALRFEVDQRGRSVEQQRLHNELRSTGVTLASREGREIAGLVNQLAVFDTQAEAAAERQAELNSTMQFFGDQALTSIIDLRDGFATLDDVAARFVNTLADAALQAALLGQGPLGNMFGTAGANGNVGGLFGALASALPGFATGGSFTVGGRAGTDRNLVAFRATAGERVDVTPPGSGRTGGGNVEVNIINNGGGQVETRESRTADGGKRIDVVFDEVVAANINRHGSQTRAALAGLGGLVRR